MSGSAPATSCRPTPSARKKRAIRRRLRRVPPRSVLLAEDETDLRLFPPLRCGWAVKGEPAAVPISGANAKRVLFGSINIWTGHRLFLVRHHGRGPDCEAFLDEIHEHYRGWQVALLLDEDSSHTAADTQALAEDYDIELLWLPKRSPHLNPMDHLWRHGKEVQLANYQHESIDAQAARLVSYLANLPAQEALRKAGILSGSFWLRT
jgi:transposase InsO family protein